MKRVVLLSGGVDSSTCLAKALADCRPEDVLAVNMYYGQRHDREIQSARDIAAHYGVELMSLDLSAIFVRSFWRNTAGRKIAMNSLVFAPKRCKRY